MDKNECFNETSSVSKFGFFYCKNKEDTISQIKKKMPIFKFISYDLNSTFEINADDLLYVQGDYVYCLMYWVSYLQSSWYLGKPFLKKYQFIFNPDTKTIGYYTNSNNEDGGGFVSKETFIVVIIIVIVVVVVICGIIGKILFDKFRRKKRANELTDDEFDYTQKEDATNKLGV